MQKVYDTIVIGGGPAGMMAAIFASENNKKVLLLERNNFLGRKLLMTGGGRCNLSNVLISAQTMKKHYGKNGDFLQSAMQSFGPAQVRAWFAKRGLLTKEEDNGRVFPISENAKDVLRVLQNELTKSDVLIEFETEVLNFLIRENKIIGLNVRQGSASKTIEARNYIVASGGRSYLLPNQEANIFGELKKIGVQINKLSPSLSPIKTVEKDIRELQGISLRNVILTAKEKVKIFSEQGDLVFTHFGISGPLALNLSKHISNFEAGTLIAISLDFLPQHQEDKMIDVINSIVSKHSNKTFSNALKELLPEKLIDLLLRRAQIQDSISNQVSKNDKIAIIKQIKHFSLQVEKNMGFDMAMTTAGGIDIAQIDQKTMKIKKFDNLFAAGEVIDVDGISGGFNLQISWTTGYCAGCSANKQNDAVEK